MGARRFWAAALFGAAAGASQSAAFRGSRRVNSDHVAVASQGCGKSPPYAVGKTTVATANYGGAKWTFRVYLPSGYDASTPSPVILEFPGWGVSAEVEERGAGITALADKLGYVSVTPQGLGDDPNWGGPWYSWNCVGSTQSPGPAGPTCTSQASNEDYCYTSCGGCSDRPQCWWTTCRDCVSPTGTGTSDVGGFVTLLYDTLESQLCIDTTREYAAGESNGGMMTYQVGVDLSSRLAAVVPGFGSFHRGFSMSPENPIPVLDFHGTEDTVVPANVSLSSDGYYYTPTAEIFGGNEYCRGWKAANNCSGPTSHYPTSLDGVAELYCVSEGTCTGGDVVRCSWNGGHNWFDNSAASNGQLVTEFLLKWAKASHLGGGRTFGEEPRPLRTLEDFEVELEPLQQKEAAAGPLSQPPGPVVPGGHYGDPGQGCLDDEDVIRAGHGTVCAPRIGYVRSDDESAPPSPQCKIGGTRPRPNGCPTDAAVSNTSQAFPVCLAKGEDLDPYQQGQFHCLLACPCPAGDSDDCGAEAHSHCPSGAFCERGELRLRVQGVCTYHSSPVAKILAV